MQLNSKIHVVKNLGLLLAFWKMQHLLLIKLEMYVLLIIHAGVKKINHLYFYAFASNLLSDEFCYWLCIFT